MQMGRKRCHVPARYFLYKRLDHGIRGVFASSQFSKITCLIISRWVTSSLKHQRLLNKVSTEKERETVLLHRSADIGAWREFIHFWMNAWRPTLQVKYLILPSPSTSSLTRNIKCDDGGFKERMCVSCPGLHDTNILARRACTRKLEKQRAITNKGKGHSSICRKQEFVTLKKLSCDYLPYVRHCVEHLTLNLSFYPLAWTLQWSPFLGQQMSSVGIYPKIYREYTVEGFKPPTAEV